MARPRDNDQHVSIRISWAGAIWVASRSRKFSPRRRIRSLWNRKERIDPRTLSGYRKSDLPQDAAEHRQSLVDAAAQEELLGGPPFQLELVGHGRSAGGLEVGVRGLGAAAGVGQGVAEGST